MYVPSLEFGLPHPLSRKRVCTSPRNQRGGAHTRKRVRGWGSPNSNDWRKSLALCLLCASDYESFVYLSLSYSYSSIPYLSALPLTPTYFYVNV